MNILRPPTDCLETHGCPRTKYCFAKYEVRISDTKIHIYVIIIPMLFRKNTILIMNIKSIIDA